MFGLGLLLVSWKIAPKFWRLIMPMMHSICRVKQPEMSSCVGKFGCVAWYGQYDW